MAPRLDAAHLEQILAVVRDVSACSDAETFREVVVDSLPSLIDADLYHLMDADARTGTLDVVMAPEERAVPDEVAFAAFNHHHPLAHHYLESGDGSAIRLSDVIEPADYHDLPIYREHYADHGVEYQLGATVPCPETRLFSVGLNREHDDFDPTDVAVLDRLRPHLVQSARNVEIRSRLAELADGGGDGDVHGAARVERGRIIDANDDVVDAIRDAFGAEPSPSSLPDHVDGWSRAERRRLEHVDDRTGARLYEPLLARREHGRVVLRYVEGDNGTDTLVVDRRGSDDAERLLGYGLTIREAEVLAELAQGATNAQIGRSLGISTHTVRKHLERVYKKLSVDSRTAAVALAYEVFSGRPPS